MSNYLAVATVTAAIGEVLSGIEDVMPGSGITYLRPDRIDRGTNTPELGINIFLYNAGVDPGFRNADLPTRGVMGELTTLPQIALDLYYLISFYGDDSKFEPQRLMGWTEAALETSPIMTRNIIRAAIASHQPYLTGSDLFEQNPLIAVSPQTLSIEDLAKVWSTLLHAPFLLSSAYKATVVLMSLTITPPMPAPPVLERNIALFPNIDSVIESVVPASTQPNTRIAILGRDFKGDSLEVTVGDRIVRVPAGNPSRIELDLPDLQAGSHPVYVTPEVNVGTSGAPQMRLLQQSNSVLMTVEPQIAAIDISAPSKIVVTAAPVIGQSQQVSLWLFPEDGPGVSPYGLSGAPRTEPTANLVFDAANVPAGAYLARLSVDQSITSAADGKSIDL